MNKESILWLGIIVFRDLHVLLILELMIKKILKIETLNQ